MQLMDDVSLVMLLDHRVAPADYDSLALWVGAAFIA